MLAVFIIAGVVIGGIFATGVYYILKLGDVI